MDKFSFDPIANDFSKVLILGSLPGDESLRAGQYYANKRNQFWRLVSLGGDLSDCTYSEKCGYLLNRGIALWDVLKEASRTGSLDSNIKNEVPNDFDGFFIRFPNIRFILFNGTKAEEAFKRFYPEYYGSFPNIRLPSSSPANTIPFKEKKEIWSLALSRI